MKSVTHYPSAIWYRYKNFVEQAVGTHDTDDINDIEYWREKMLTNCILYAIPVSFLALIPSVSVLVDAGYQFLPLFDVFMVIAITLVTFNKRISLRFRKTFIVVMFYLLATTLMGTLGSFGIGSIYLLALCVFISLLYSSRSVFWSIIANITVYAGFAVVMYLKLFDTPLIKHYSVGFWIAYSCNFIFLNIATVVQVRHVINKLENNIAQEAKLRQDLEVEIGERVRRTERLAESEEHYKTLFHHNPSPMWIYDVDTLAFLQVNESAMYKYGYTHEEYMGMTLKDIRPEGQVDELFAMLKREQHATAPTRNTAIHRRKNGEEFYVDVRCNAIPFRGKNARLVIANDISAQIKHLQDIEKQNHKLQQIAFMQSHIVRAPLCRIMGLVDLIMKYKENGVDYEMMEYLNISVKELDEVIKTIILTTDNSDQDPEEIAS
ncbi:PAS domain-containing protein [Mucilaginibacter lacusdianchii]|uniref:PAS domain-containing protein n=1 Tax=Mucilaginibacter lacusdianchii TaxID=2684211 RepID=UPI00131C2CE5|nr:PAS domain S-box protein [Mucilaginibacter sp. JXJ CY 39]